jgi:hypothetical protein
MEGPAMPMDPQPRYHVVPDPKRPSHYRVKDRLSGNLVSISFPSRRLADRSADRRNTRRSEGQGR